MIRIDLKQFKREAEARQQRDLSWADIRNETGIAESTLNRLMNNKAQRVDLNVLARLCKMLGAKSGEPVPFLIYEYTEE
jgi:DNA-binding Xre family transcriptional regulator